MIYLGSDHAGFQAKEEVKALLEERGQEYTDLGTDSEESVDYPDFGFAVAQKVGSSQEDLGILLCGSGVGMSIAANKVKGVKAALATTPYMGAQSREHDAANVLVLAGRVNTLEEIREIATEFLDARFTNEERHARRVGKIEEYENQHTA